MRRQRILMAWIRTQSSKVTTTDVVCVWAPFVSAPIVKTRKVILSGHKEDASTRLRFQAAELRQKINKSNGSHFQLLEPDFKIALALIMK